jgi:hypothetical protein
VKLLFCEVVGLVIDLSDQRLKFFLFLLCSRGSFSDLTIWCSMKCPRGCEKFVGLILIHHSFARVLHAFGCAYALIQES